MKNTQTILDVVTPKQLADYEAFRITSEELGKLTGFHPTSIRRAIKREPRKRQRICKTVETQALKERRQKLAHLPLRDIARLANVSSTTASRIKKRWREECQKTESTSTS